MWLSSITDLAEPLFGLGHFWNHFVDRLNTHLGDGLGYSCLEAVVEVCISGDGDSISREGPPQTSFCGDDRLVVRRQFENLEVYLVRKAADENTGILGFDIESDES